MEPREPLAFLLAGGASLSGVDRFEEAEPDSRSGVARRAAVIRATAPEPLLLLALLKLNGCVCVVLQ